MHFGPSAEFLLYSLPNANYYYFRHCQESTKTISIKLTSMYECGNVDRQRGNIYVVPYSDHSSHTELKEFVDQLRPLKLYPIVVPKIPKV